MWVELRIDLFEPSFRKLFGMMAGSTGLEPAASAVTGQRSNQLNYDPACAVADLLPPEGKQLGRARLSGRITIINVR